MMFQTVGIGFLPTFLETKTKFRTYPLPHADPPGSCRHSGHPHPAYAPEQQTTPAVERSANDSGFRLRGRFFETQAHQVKSTCNFRSYLIIQVKKNIGDDLPETTGWKETWTQKSRSEDGVPMFSAVPRLDKQDFC